MVAIDNGNARRVVAAIFEPSQAIEQNRRGLRASHVTYNPAHLVSENNSFSSAMKQPVGMLKRRACSGRKLIDRAFVISAAVDSRAVEVSRAVRYHSIIGEGAVGRALEPMDNGLGPLC